MLRTLEGRARSVENSTDVVNRSAIRFAALCCRKLSRSGGADGPEWLATVLGAAAVFFATVNVVGGYLVTDRMLGMFKKRPSKPAPKTPEA